MKKTLITVIFACILLGCEDQTNLTYVPYDPGTDGGVISQPSIGTSTLITLTEYGSVALKLTKYNFSEQQNNISKLNNIASYSFEKMIKDHLTKLNVDYKIENVDIASLARTIASKSSALTYDGTPFTLETQITDITKYYNTSQIGYLNTYFNNMYNATDAATANSYYTSAKANVNANGRLTYSQKIAVLGIIEYANQFAASFFNGDYQYVMIDVSTTTGIPLNNKCQINFKSVWRSAVVAGMAGGVSGAYIGATGGTVTLPLVGTVTGAVGGGVFGFAGGFVGGSFWSVVEQGFFGCLLGSPYVHSQQCDDLWFMINYPQLCIAVSPASFELKYFLN